MNETAGPAVHHDEAAQRFVVDLDGHQGVLEYTLAQGVMRLVHTGVPAAIGGRGVAANLVRNALDFARARGYKVRPDCSYAEAWMQRHPEQQDLLA
jgi:uncharacterized protein